MALRLPKDKRNKAGDRKYGGSPAHTRAARQEAQVAADLGGGVTPRSGAGSIKGDVRVRKRMRVECKTTTAKSFSVTRTMLDKIENAAMPCGEIPAMVIEFLDGQGIPQGSYAVVPYWVLKEIVDHDTE